MPIFDGVHFNNESRKQGVYHYIGSHCVTHTSYQADFWLGTNQGICQQRGGGGPLLMLFADKVGGCGWTNANVSEK